MLQDLGTRDFGRGIVADASVALWRTRGEHRLLVGAFAGRVKSKWRHDVHDKAREPCVEFFIRQQSVGSDGILLDATKTSMVCRLKGNSPQAHE